MQSFVCVLSVVSTIIYITYLTITLCLFVEKPNKQHGWVIPSSLSETHYLYTERFNVRYVFSIAMWLMALSLIPSWIEISSGHPFQFLSFICPVALMFVGATPNFKVGSDGVVHMIAALICAITSIMWVSLVAQLWWVVLTFLVVFSLFASFTRTVKGSYVFWLEMVAFFSTYCGILFYNFIIY